MNVLTASLKLLIIICTFIELLMEAHSNHEFKKYLTCYGRALPKILQIVILKYFQISLFFKITILLNYHDYHYLVQENNFKKN